MAKKMGLVVIGRNEGERLRGSLTSCRACTPTMVYVDSGSTDQSVTLARSMGIPVLALDSSSPYNAARARNEGLRYLLMRHPSLEFIQFVDGDCELDPNWLLAALRAMGAGPRIAVVSGRRREKFPEKSLYQRLFEVEWNKPSGETDGGEAVVADGGEAVVADGGKAVVADGGKRRPQARTARASAGPVEIDSCGGDALIRVSAFREVGGFDPTLAAGEEPELCFRLRQKGWKILRVDSEMTIHESGMSHLNEWAARQVRAGRAAGDIFFRTRTYKKQIRSVRLWTAGWLTALLAATGGALYFGGPAAALISALAIVLALPLQMFRVAAGAFRSGNNWKSSVIYGIFTVLGKWPEGVGQILSWRNQRRWVGRPTHHRSIAFIAGFYPSLSETFVYREVRALRQRGWTVRTVSLWESPDKDREEFKELIKDHRVVYGRAFGKTLIGTILEIFFHPRRSLATLTLVAHDFFFPEERLSGIQRLKLWVQGVASLGLAFYLRPLGVRHLHAHFAHSPATIARYTARELGLPFSFTGHANDLFRRRTLLRKKLRDAAFVSCISQWHCGFYESLEPSANGRYRLIRCGVDTDQFGPSRRGKRTGGILRLVTVCRLVEKKGIDTLIQALALLTRVRGQISGESARDLSPHKVGLTIVGEGPERKRLESLAFREGVSEKIRWLGGVSNEKVRELLSEADLFVLPCRTDSRGDRDGIPVALMEAMSTGLPVIAGDMAPLKELVEDGKNGLILRESSAPQLAKLISSLTRDPAERRRMGAAARKKIEEEFSAERNVTLLEQALSEAIDPVILSPNSYHPAGIGTKNARGRGLQENSKPVRYCLISPCRDEARFLERTIESVLAQTLRPAMWVIVDDGSSDGTFELLAEYARLYDWIRVIHRPDRGERRVGGGVVEAFYEGYRTIEPDKYDYLCKLDMDLKLPPRYFEILIRRMEADSQIGTASGKPYFRVKDRMIPEVAGDEMSVGMTKLYRTACFRQIGGFVPEIMWDGIDCHRARMLGWKAASWNDPELRFIHLRPMGSSHRNILAGRFRHGAGQYFMGTGFLYLFASACFRMGRRPWVAGGVAILSGYLWSAFRRRPRYADPEFRNFLKSYQRECLSLGKRETTRRCDQRRAPQESPREDPQPGPARIGYFIPEFPGQTHTFIWREKEALARQGLQVDLISTRRPRALEAPHAWTAQAIQETEYLWPIRWDLFIGGLREIAWAGRRGWARCIKAGLPLFPWIFFGAGLAWLARQRGWKHVHVHSCGNAAAIALFASRLSGLTYSLTLHARLSDFGPYQKAKWRHAHFAVFVTPGLIAEARETLGFLPPVVRVAPMGVDPILFRRGNPYVPWEGRGPCRIFACGRLNFSKGHLDLIEALKILREKGVEAQLFIAGGEDASRRGDCRRVLQERIRDLSLEHSVRLLGPLSETQIRDELEKTQLFISASHQEGVSVSLMEAMAMGVPVVATRVGGIPDLVEDGKQGLLVPPQDPEELAKAAKVLLEQPALSSKMGEWGRRRVQNFYTAERGADVLAQCLAEPLR